MANNQKAAVISGDIIGSSLLNPASRRKLQQIIDAFLKHSAKQWPDMRFQQYRGDSLQVIFTSNRLASLRMVLLLHSFLIQENYKIRLAVGVGEISFKSKQLITSDGSAFQTSGPYLDELAKNGDVISIAGISEEFTSEWQVHSATLNYLIQRLTPQQAQALYLQLQNLTQEAIAKRLKIKQPSVSQRLQAAGWPVVNKILTRFESVIPAL